MGDRREKKIPGFTQKYNVTKLAWFEAHGRATSAIAREKQVKGWSRAKKVARIEKMNPHWRDLTVTFQGNSSLIWVSSEHKER